MAANVSVNRMRCLLDGQERNYIQLGTVMTRQDCRGRGYSRLLMEEVLRENRLTAEQIAEDVAKML